jgi:hypothetical protein
MKLPEIFERLFENFLSEKNKKRIERIILWVAIISFIAHLIIIGLVHFNIIAIEEPSNLLTNPIAAIYTPFSFILVYEVYLLIYYLPKSTSIYVSKQYEIITLIIFRRLFKDLSDLNLKANWFDNKSDLQFTFDLLTAIVLFYLIYLFHISRSKIYDKIKKIPSDFTKISKFIIIKKWIALALFPILIYISIFSLYHWSLGIFHPDAMGVLSFKNINNIFFEQFFTILIFTDVLLLLFSFFHTDHFHKVIRNSGFIISTILLRISFSVDGIINNILIITAVVFGLIVMIIHNKFEKHLEDEIIERNNELEG